jgi:hypothetical protein
MHPHHAGCVRKLHTRLRNAYTCNSYHSHCTAFYRVHDMNMRVSSLLLRACLFFRLCTYLICTCVRWRVHVCTHDRITARNFTQAFPARVHEGDDACMYGGKPLKHVHACLLCACASMRVYMYMLTASSDQSSTYQLHTSRTHAYICIYTLPREYAYMDFHVYDMCVYLCAVGLFSCECVPHNPVDKLHTNTYICMYISLY